MPHESTMQTLAYAARLMVEKQRLDNELQEHEQRIDRMNESVDNLLAEIGVEVENRDNISLQDVLSRIRQSNENLRAKLAEAIHFERKLYLFVKALSFINNPETNMPVFEEWIDSYPRRGGK